MTKFVFFRGYVGTLNVMDGETYATASLNNNAPEGHMNRRMLYHTDRNLLDNVRGEIPRGQLGTPERHQDILRRLQTTNEQRDLNDNPIRLFQATTVTTVNPKFWTKVKIVLQESWRLEPIGVVVVSILLTMVTIIGIAKILSIW
jgi:hypothetical protein